MGSPDLPLNLGEITTDVGMKGPGRVCLGKMTGCPSE